MDLESHILLNFPAVSAIFSAVIYADNSAFCCILNFIKLNNEKNDAELEKRWLVEIQ